MHGDQTANGNLPIHNMENVSTNGVFSMASAILAKGSRGKLILWKFLFRIPKPTRDAKSKVEQKEAIIATSYLKETWSFLTEIGCSL